jgi:DNA (cytosine-5)-methyltransferase 1
LIKIFEAFAGIGANTKALRNLGIEHEVVGYSELDKYASKAFSLIHDVPEALNYGDITKIVAEELPDFDLFTFGFPCQSFSVAGKRMGFEDERGILFFDAFRILKAKLPKYFIFENVQGLLNHDKGNTLTVIMEHLGQLPYEITMDLLNSKDYGIPQNRLRLFCIGRRLEDA